MSGFGSSVPRRRARRVRAAMLAAALGVAWLAAPARPAADLAPLHAVAWGRNLHGQLGNGASGEGSDQLTPVAVLNQPLGFKKVSASRSSHSLAIAGNGTVWAWGANARNQLGRAGGASASPVPVNMPAGVVDVAAGNRFSVAVRTDGSVWTWGDNEYAQLGHGGAGGNRRRPSRSPGCRTWPMSKPSGTSPWPCAPTARSGAGAGPTAARPACR